MPPQLLYTEKAMEIYLIRLKNLRSLIADAGGPAAFARLTGEPGKGGYSKGYINILAGPTPTRNINEKTARGIESKIGKPKGWLDVEHADVTGVDADLLSTVMAQSRDRMKKARIVLSSMQFAILALLTYEHCQLKGGIGHAEVFLGKMVDLLRSK